MKKILSLLAVGFVFFGSSKAQMQVDGGQFANHPERYNNKQITLKNVSVEVSNDHHGHAGPGMGAHHGPQGGHEAPCNPPRGSEKVSLKFKSNPDYSGCFFANSRLINDFKRKAGNRSDVNAVVTIKGNTQMGFTITFIDIAR